MAQGVRDSAPDAQIVCMPMADGGEGVIPPEKSARQK
ncbi:glycerate kinase [Pseudomonas aeruginosa]|nr:glycerate kinase [Pseudomonas aeruginosa]